MANSYFELAARLAEQAALAGGGLSTGDNELDAATTIEVTDGALSLVASGAASGVVAINGELGISMQAPGTGGAMVRSIESGTGLETFTADSWSVVIDDGVSGTEISLEPNLFNLSVNSDDDSNVVINAGGGGAAALTIGAGANTISLTGTGTGFYGGGPTPKPTVPLTTPSVQDVIDALVAIGLVTQSD